MGRPGSAQRQPRETHAGIANGSQPGAVRVYRRCTIMRKPEDLGFKNPVSSVFNFILIFFG
jgi:hypothetical protein